MMRLLRFSSNDDFELISFDTNNLPLYAILSHTWIQGEEVTYDDIVSGAGKNKAGYAKIRFCGERATEDNLQYFWVDTCCIDKRDNTELAEAINSMFRWYQGAARCYAYLSDVSTSVSGTSVEMCQSAWEADFRRSRWFNRGWTLQELLAPSSVQFYSSQAKILGDKISLSRVLQEVTGIPIRALHGHALNTFSVEERMAWSAKRQTTKIEDSIYCLFGIFNVFMPLLYGEGKENALRRLQREIDGLERVESRPSAPPYRDPRFTSQEPVDTASQAFETLSVARNNYTENARKWKPRFYFFYGASKKRHYLASRLRLKSLPTMYDARLPGCSIAAWGTWKVLLNGPAEHFAHGKAYLAERARHDRELQTGETDEYRLEDCRILVMFGGQEVYLEAKVYKFYGSTVGLTEVVAGAKPFKAI